MLSRVWSRFQGRGSDGTLVKLRIQDLPESRYDDAIELYVQYFFKEETFHKAAGVARNPQAVAESREIVTASMKDPAFHHVICCVDRDDDITGQIVGVSSIELTTVGLDPFEGIKVLSNEVQIMFNLLDELSLTKVMEELQISQFYDDRGMVVHPEFRKLGVATEFLKTRRLACVANNVAATGALMTSVATQKAAERDNWETAMQVNLGQLGKKHGVSEYIMTDQVMWSRFQARRSDGTTVKFCIRDLPEDRRDDAVELFVKYFMPEEVFHKAAGTARNPKAILELQAIITNSMRNPAFHCVICCEDNDNTKDGKIVGVSAIEIATVGLKRMEEIKMETKESQTLYKLLEATSLYNIMEKLNVSKFYDDRGIVVHPGFRKLGIAVELLKTRRSVCMAHNVPVTGALMTSIATQKAAVKDNWQTVLEVNLEELGQQHGVSFEDGGVRKIMIWKNPYIIKGNW